MFEQVMSLAQEPWVIPGVAYGALWLSLIGMKLIYKKIKVASPLADSQQQLFNGLSALLSAADGWEKLGDNSVKCPANGSRKEIKVVYAGLPKDQVVTLGDSPLAGVLTKKQINKLLAQGKQVGQELDQRKAKSELAKLTASLR